MSAVSKKKKKKKQRRGDKSFTSKKTFSFWSGYLHAKAQRDFLLIQRSDQAVGGGFACTDPLFILI